MIVPRSRERERERERESGGAKHYFEKLPRSACLGRLCVFISVFIRSNNRRKLSGQCEVVWVCVSVSVKDTHHSMRSFRMC